MKLFFTFLFMLLVSAGITFFLTHKLESDKKSVVKPLSVSSFSMDDAPSDSLKGEIATMSGEVLWQSRIASEPAQLQTPRQVLQGENLVTRDFGEVLLSYKNVASITIQPNSELDIIQTLPANFVFTQKSGTVSYQKLGIVPLSVKTEGLLINQEEGEMTVSFDPDGTIVRIYVKEGTVKTAYADEIETNRVATVVSGNTLTYDLENGVELF